MLPRFEVLTRLRPVDLVAPGLVAIDEVYAAGAPAASSAGSPQPAAYAAITARLDHAEVAGRLDLVLTSGGVRLSGWYDGGRRLLGLDVTDASGRTTHHRSRRHGQPATAVRTLGLSLTGTHLTVLAHDGTDWTAHGRVDLTGRVDTRDEGWLAGLASGHAWTPRGEEPAPISRLTAGAFGQLGLRDLRFVTHADGTPYREGTRLLLTATHAGPGFFDTAHTGIWSLDTSTWALEHRADLFFRRPDRPGVFGDHATHLVRDADRWLVATSTWGDFDQAVPGARVEVTLAETDADLLSGRHVLDTRPLPLPTDGFRSVGVWDPHLVRIDGLWHVGFVSARRFFSFHPALAVGPTLENLTLRGAVPDRVATEGTTLVRLDEGWRVLASDGRGSRRVLRRRFPIFDLDLHEVGALDAPYPTNIPWPTLVRDGEDWLMVTFNGDRVGGPLVGYGSHGTVVVAGTGNFADPPPAV